MKAMVLAAGVGSRLDPLTTQLPKPLVPVGNRPVLEHILRLLGAHGLHQVISNLHYLPEKIESYFGDGSQFGCQLSFRVEHELTGDAGGVRACRDFLAGDTFIVMMGDLLTDADLTAVIAQHKAKKALATIALKEVEDVSHFGVALLDKQGFITGFQEKPAKAEALSNLASTGIYILEPAVFDLMPATGSYGFGRHFFPMLLERQLPVLGVPIASYWSDVGTIHQYRLSNFDALNGRLKVVLPGEKTAWGRADSGARVDAAAQVQGQLLIGKNSTVGPGCRILGDVIIGDNCQIHEGATLEDSIIWSNSVVEANAQLTACVVGSHCVVQNGSSAEDIASVSWQDKVASGSK